MPNI
jgi:hypothetical protein